jgi:hypothetical protein
MTGRAGRNKPSDEHRRTLARLADLLIPRLGEMPAASSVGVATYLLERVLESRPDLADGLTSILEAARGTDPEEAILRLERDDPEGFRTLFTAVAGGYYMSDEVRQRLGYTGQRALHLDTREPLEALTKPVVERGRIYRRP